MNPLLKNNEIDMIVKAVSMHKEAEQAILFGSRATGKAKANSDVDICLKGINVTFDTQLKVSSALEDLPLPYFFDVINYNTINNERLKIHIAECGINLLDYVKKLL
jgi:predicted nucleotidyltransferase